MIRIECPRCGTRLRGPDEAAGTKIKCPKCASPILVPEPVYDPEPLDDVDPYSDDPSPADAYGLDEKLPARSGGYSPSDDPSDERRKPCPVCGEMIVAGAAKCRFCGEVFDAKLKKAKVKKKSKSYSRDDDELSGTDMVLCLLCPGIACIASIVYMVQGKGKGLKVFGLSIVGNVFWGVVRVIIESQNK